jgi:hypothetical protein
LKSGNLPGFKIGRVWRFDLDEITQWMESGRSSPDGRSKASPDARLATEGRPLVSGRAPAETNSLARNAFSDGNGSADGHATANGRAPAKPTRSQERSQTASRPSPKDDRRSVRPKR